MKLTPTRTVIGALSAATLLGVGTAYAGADNNEPTAVAQAATYTAPVSTLATRYAEPDSIDPYSSTGTWLVPSEILPGRYRATVKPGVDSGYYMVCASYGCDAFGNGEFVTNGYFSGSSIFVVPDYAVSVELHDVTLEEIR